MRGAIIAFGLLVAAPAAAQNSTTVCNRQLDGSVKCDTTDGRSAFQRGYDASVQRGLAQERAIDGMLHNKALRDAEIESKADAARLQYLGDLVAAGKCDEARRYALTAGQLDLAQQVDSICKPAPAR